MICERCKKDYKEKDMYFKRPEDRENVCVWCAGEYMVCDICGEWYHLNDLEMDEQSEVWVCTNCRKKSF